MYSDTYDEFEKEYRAFCGTKGLCLDHLPVNLRHLYTLACKHSGLNRDTPLDTWDGVSKSVTMGFLPGKTLREQYCMYLEGFQAYITCVNNNAVSSSSPEGLPERQPAAVQQMGPSPFNESPGENQRPRSKLPAKHHKLVQELHRRRGEAAVVPPAFASGAPSHAASVASLQHHPTAVSGDQGAAKPSRPATEPVLDSCKQPLAAVPVQAATTRANKPGQQAKHPARAAAKPVNAAAKPAKPAQPAAAAPPPPPPGRRSGRVRTQFRPAGYVNSLMIHTESSSSDSGSEDDSSSDSSDTDASDREDDGTGSKCPWNLGPDYQAALPQLQQLPPRGPQPAEAKYLSQPVYTPAAPAGVCNSTANGPNPGIALIRGVFHKLWDQAGSGPARVQLLEGWLNKMDQYMGQHLAQSLGLSRLGSKLRATWAPHEEILFALGMLDKYRKFRHIRRCYLPKRSVHDLNSYYYNVWKNRAGPVPEEFAVLNEDPSGDGPAWRRRLCRRLAAMWDHETMGPIPTLAQQDPAAAAAVAADKQQTIAAAVAKQQATAAAVAKQRAVAAAVAKQHAMAAAVVKQQAVAAMVAKLQAVVAAKAVETSTSRGSTREEPAAAAAAVRAVVAVKVPVSAAPTTPAVAAAHTPAVAPAAAVASREARRQNIKHDAGDVASAAAVAAGIIARLTATAGASSSAARPAAAARAGAGAVTGQQPTSGIHGGNRDGRGNTSAAVHAGHSDMKQQGADASHHPAPSPSSRPGAVGRLQQKTAGQGSRLTGAGAHEAAPVVQKVRQQEAAATAPLQTAAQASTGVRQCTVPQQPALLQPISVAARQGGVQQLPQQQQHVSPTPDTSPQQSSGTESSSGSESDAGVESGSSASPSSTSSSHGSGPERRINASGSISGSGSRPELGGGVDCKLQSDAGHVSSSPSAAASTPDSDDADHGSHSEDAVAAPLAVVSTGSPGCQQLQSGPAEASSSHTGNASTSSSSTSSDSSTSSSSSSDDPSDDDSNASVSRQGKRTAVKKSCPDASPSVIMLTSDGSDHEDGCGSDAQHRQLQKQAVGRKRRRSGSQGSRARGGSVPWSEDDDGVICISD